MTETHTLPIEATLPRRESATREVGIRAINFKDPQEIKRMQEIAADPNVQKYLGYYNDPDTIMMIEKLGLGKTFAVTEKTPGMKGPEDDMLKGWVYFCIDRSALTQRFRTADNSTDAYTISYAKHAKTRTGIMGRAIQEACSAIAAGGVRRDVVAYADINNVATWHVLESAGFRRVDEVIKPSDDRYTGDTRVYAYKLDWERFDEIIQKKDNARLFTPLDTTELAMAA